MSTHPNAVLQVNLKPADMPMRTLRAIAAESTKAYPSDSDENYSIKIDGCGNRAFWVEIMNNEDGYDVDTQLAADYGDIIVYDHLTYGYGEQIEWSEVVTLVAAVEAWAKSVCERHQCTYKIVLTANYW